MSTEQKYYELLTRTDHPVFRRDFSQSSDINSPANSIMNRIFADQLKKFRDLFNEMKLNAFPNTVTALSIDDWELQYFGFTKPSLSLTQRIDELLIKFNKRFTMSLQDVIDISRAITGQTPLVTRNINLGGWILDEGVLGFTTTFGGTGGSLIGTYLVTFLNPVDPELLQRLDERLTIIEKGGSRHIIKAALPSWVLDQSALSVTTTLE